MSALLLAGALLSQAMPLVTVQGVEGTLDKVDVAYAELMQGDNKGAAARIRANPTLDSDDPAALINLGTATARMGDKAKARSYYEAALVSRSVYDLELADGSWMGSRQAARTALTKLNKGETLALR